MGGRTRVWSQEWRKEVKVQMIQRGMSQNELAAALGFTRTYISSVINGSTYSRAAIRKISGFLGIPDPESKTVAAFEEQSIT